MALHVVKCPKCNSTFNTSAASLESADGRVRCGACLSIFHARENFIEINIDSTSSEEESVFLNNNLR